MRLNLLNYCIRTCGRLLHNAEKIEKLIENATKLLENLKILKTIGASGQLPPIDVLPPPNFWELSFPIGNDNIFIVIQ